MERLWRRGRGCDDQAEAAVLWCTRLACAQVRTCQLLVDLLSTLGREAEAARFKGEQEGKEVELRESADLAIAKVGV